MGLDITSNFFCIMFHFFKLGLGSYLHPKNFPITDTSSYASNVDT